MAEKTFEDYIQLFDKYRREQDNSTDLCAVAKGMRETFPKKPTSSDYFHVCYAYWSRAALPMEEDDKLYWGEKIKQAFRRVGDLDPQYQDANRLNLLRMGWNAELPVADLYRMAKKSEDEVSDNFAGKNDITKIKYQMASRYFANVIKEAEKIPDYKSELAMYKKAYNLLFDVVPSARYETYKFFRGKLKDVYMQSEWGRREWNHDEALMRDKVYKSLPKEIKMAMTRNMSGGRDY